MCNGTVFLCCEIDSASLVQVKLADFRWSRDELVTYEEVILITHGSSTSVTAVNFCRGGSRGKTGETQEKSGNNKPFNTIWMLSYIARLFLLFNRILHFQHIFVAFNTHSFYCQFLWSLWLAAIDLYHVWCFSSYLFVHLTVLSHLCSAIWPYEKR
jgi:hypothetical protein